MTMSLQDSPKEYLETCRAALAAEQAKSLAETSHWSHVDRQQVHLDWDAFYKELAPMVDEAQPAAPEVQQRMARHYAIASRFYVPSDKAYVGMALFYQENQGMNDFHNAYHPRMVEFLGEAMYVFARRTLG